MVRCHPRQVYEAGNQAGLGGASVVRIINSSRPSGARLAQAATAGLNDRNPHVRRVHELRRLAAGGSFALACLPAPIELLRSDPGPGIAACAAFHRLRQLYVVAQERQRQLATVKEGTDELGAEGVLSLPQGVAQSWRTACEVGCHEPERRPRGDGGRKTPRHPSARDFPAPHQTGIELARVKSSAHPRAACRHRATPGNPHARPAGARRRAPPASDRDGHRRVGRKTQLTARLCGTSKSRRASPAVPRRRRPHR